ncbi:Acyl- N-acyltransferase [Fusarium albosuccineum]|uniref:Acyl- N-acyltransferase n=1 Tax=Fusarium albosuccineum TaxID=1237068 RepID=A0A8H4L508_9HYPO|nr:Acyl- N-acyltransferase [Fusarium albosuccineum]
MSTTATNDIACPVALIASNLVLVPTPIAIASPSYRALYASLHADASFCQMGFGDHFPARSWSDEETYQSILTRDVNNDWRNRGVGDFAVGLWDESVRENIFGDDLTTRSLPVPGFEEPMRVLDISRESSREFGAALEAIEWVGYAGVRGARDVEHISSWKEKVEIRYGVSPEHWGKGIANRSAQVVMAWAHADRGITKFIAETERANTRSGRVLERLGFVQLEEAKYWKEPSEVEWERTV